MSRGHLSLSGETSVPVFKPISHEIMLPELNAKTRLVSDTRTASACQVSHTDLRMIVHHSMCACHLHSACPSLLHRQMLHARVTKCQPSSAWCPTSFHWPSYLQQISIKLVYARFLCDARACSTCFTGSQRKLDTTQHQASRWDFCTFLGSI